MKRYKNLSGCSGVVAYDIGEKNIRVRFRDGSIYDYTHSNPGEKHVERMKLLAESGRGLTTYINKYIREKYAEKIK